MPVSRPKYRDLQPLAGGLDGPDVSRGKTRIRRAPTRFDLFVSITVFPVGPLLHDRRWSTFGYWLIWKI